jgi:ankyrin repeat protein
MDSRVAKIKLRANKIHEIEHLTDTHVGRYVEGGVIGLMELARDGDVRDFKAKWQHFNLNRGAAFKDVKFGEQEKALVKLYAKQVRAVTKLVTKLCEDDEQARDFAEQARKVAKVCEDDEQAREVADQARKVAKLCEDEELVLALANLYEDEKQARPLAKLDEDRKQTGPLAKLDEDKKQTGPLAKLDEDKKQTALLANFEFAKKWIESEVRQRVEDVEYGEWRKKNNGSQNGGDKGKDKAGRTGTNDGVGGNGTNDRVGFNLLSGGGRKRAKDGGRGEKAKDGVREEAKKVPEVIYNALPAIYPGRTALHMAAANGNVRIVEAICGTKDVDLNKKDVFGYTPLHLACYSLHENRDKVIKTLLSCNKINANVSAKEEGYYLTALHLAVKARSKDVVDMLLDWDPQRKNEVLDVDARSKFGLTAFHIAVQEALNAKFKTERADFVTMIVGFIRFMNKHSPEAINKSDKTKSTPLHTCVENNDHELVELLLEDGDKIDPELLDAKGRTALEIAVQQGDYAMVQMIQRYLERSGLFGDHQAYADSANAILVGAALLATVTFTAWVQFPTNDSTLFWVFISFSFYFAIATFIAAAGAAIPSRGSTLGLVRRAVLASAICLEISLGCAVAAFATAGFLILPPGKPHRKVIATTAIGGFVCFFFLLTFLRKITKALDPIFLWLDYGIQSQIKKSMWEPVTEGVTSRLVQMKLVKDLEKWCEKHGLKGWYKKHVTDPVRKRTFLASTSNDDDDSTTSSSHDGSTGSSHNKSIGSSSMGKGSGRTGSTS